MVNSSLAHVKKVPGWLARARFLRASNEAFCASFEAQSK
jgi:hypothetical protein